MNSNHGVAMIADALAKGLHVDTVKAYDACVKGIFEKTLLPWCKTSACSIDTFYWKHGYIPALHPGETEHVREVNPNEKRQPVAVSLGTAYDLWCLSRIASKMGKDDDSKKYSELSLNYRKLFNDTTCFFQPKDKNGNFIEPFDYRFSGGLGARDAYDENNGWIYRWDVQHNIPNLLS